MLSKWSLCFSPMFDSQATNVQRHSQFSQKWLWKTASFAGNRGDIQYFCDNYVSITGQSLYKTPDNVGIFDVFFSASSFEHKPLFSTTINLWSECLRLILEFIIDSHCNVYICLFRCYILQFSSRFNIRANEMVLGIKRK